VQPNAFVKDRNGARSLMAVNKLLEVEEKVWSPLYGLKGNVDATVQVFLKDGDDEKTLTVPFELKTGKHQSAAHKAQTSLYTLLLSDRYGNGYLCPS
jgi:DNA replication ATP-dependent helicase Dna2